MIDGGICANYPHATVSAKDTTETIKNVAITERYMIAACAEVLK